MEPPGIRTPPLHSAPPIHIQVLFPHCCHGQCRAQQLWFAVRSTACPVSLPPMSPDAVTTLSNHSPPSFLLGTSSAPHTSFDSVSSLSTSSLTTPRISQESTPSSQATTLSHKNHASPSPVSPPVSTRNSRHGSHSSLSSDPELPTSTSPRVTSYTIMDTFMFPSKPISSHQTTSSTNTRSLLYGVPTDANSVFSRSDTIPSSRSPIPGPSQSTNSPDFSTWTITRLSASSIRTQSSEVTVTTHTSPSKATTQDILALETRSWAGSHSTGHATLSATARNPPSSTFIPLSSPVPTTSGSSTSPAVPQMTSSPTASDAVATRLGTERSTTEGSLIMINVLGSSTQPATTSVSPSVTTTATKRVDLGTVTRAFPALPPSTQLKSKDPYHDPHERVIGDSTFLRGKRELMRH